VVVAVDVPFSTTVAPFPPTPLIVPEIENVDAVDEKFTVKFAPFTVALWLVGLKL
jgi:hypothetical protein